MPGPVALVGAGEFLPSMLEIDASLLLYPSYFVVGNGAIAAVILRRRSITSLAGR